MNDFRLELLSEISRAFQAAAGTDGGHSMSAARADLSDGRPLACLGAHCATLELRTPRGDKPMATNPRHSLVDRQ
jgi:hypothetical protein